MVTNDIRWRQRYDNLSKAYANFHAAVADFSKLSKLEKEGLIQRFEYTFELAWKTLKDYLATQGVPVSYPREVIKAAHHHGLIQDGDTWMEMLESRNQMAHTYDEVRFLETISKIKGPYYEALNQVCRELGEKL